MKKAFLTTALVALMLLPSLVATPGYAGIPLIVVVEEGTTQVPVSADSDGPPAVIVVTGDPDDAITGNRGKPVVNDSLSSALSLGDSVSGDFLLWLEAMAVCIAQGLSH